MAMNQKLLVSPIYDKSLNMNSLNKISVQSVSVSGEIKNFYLGSSVKTNSDRLTVKKNFSQNFSDSFLKINLVDENINILNKPNLEPKTLDFSVKNKSKVPKNFKCKCDKSKCIKRYCDCYNNSEVCDPEICNCINCENSVKEKLNENKQIISNVIKERKNLVNLICNCSKSNCKKQYCECFKNNTKCSNLCRCINCINCDKENIKDNENKKLTINHLDYINISIVNNVLKFDSFSKNIHNKYLSKKYKRIDTNIEKTDDNKDLVDTCYNIKSPVNSNCLISTDKIKLFTTTCASRGDKIITDNIKKVRKKLEMKNYNNQSIFKQLN